MNSFLLLMTWLIDPSLQAIVGNTSAVLSGPNGPGKESNLGDVIADSFARSWDDSRIGLVPNNHIFSRNINVGPVDLKAFEAMFNAGETVDRVAVLGAQILAESRDIAASFQVSGLRIGLEAVKVQCGEAKHECSPIAGETWCPLDANRTYVLAIPSSVVSLFPNSTKESGNRALDVIQTYISNCSPIRQLVEGRLGSTQSKASPSSILIISSLLLTL